MAKELLTKHTSLAINWARSYQAVEPNYIYLLPENKTMTIKNGLLYLKNRKPEKLSNFAINLFFESLGYDMKKRAIGIILSGAGLDGAEGVATIYQQGGTVMVQTPSSALFGSMPTNAILAVTPEAINSSDKLAGELMTFVKENPFRASAPATN